MTQAPVAHGYPDWNRVSVQADTILLDVNSVATPFPGGIVYDLGYVGGFPALGFNFGVGLGGTLHGFDLQFFLDAAYTQPTTSYQFAVINGGAARRVVTTFGPYARLSIFAQAAGGTHTARVYSASQSGVPNTGTVIDYRLIGQTGTAVGAGATVTNTAFLTYPGEVHISISSPAATWVARVLVLDEFNIASNIATINGTANVSQNIKLFSPPGPLRITFQNTSGAASTFDAYAVARPTEAGA